MSGMSQTMYWVCSDVLSLILQLRNSRDLPAPDILQRRVLGLFETMMQNGREQRFYGFIMYGMPPYSQEMAGTFTVLPDEDEERRGRREEEVAGWFACKDNCRR